MPSTTADTARLQLLTQKDWPQWFEFIRTQAHFADIWDYVDPGKGATEVKFNTEPVMPTMASTTTPTLGSTGSTSQSSTDAQQATTAAETQAMFAHQFEVYKSGKKNLQHLRN